MPTDLRDSTCRHHTRRQATTKYSPPTRPITRGYISHQQTYVKVDMSSYDNTFRHSGWAFDFDSGSLEKRERTRHRVKESIICARTSAAPEHPGDAVQQHKQKSPALLCVAVVLVKWLTMIWAWAEVGGEQACIWQRSKTVGRKV